MSITFKQIVSKIKDQVNKKVKDANIKPSYIKNTMVICEFDY